MVRHSTPLMWGLLSAVAALAFVPVTRLAAGAGVPLALVVCGTYLAGAALLVGEAHQPRPLWLAWALPLVAGAGMTAALADFLSGGVPVEVRWPLAVLIPTGPVVAVLLRIRQVRATRR
jgi:hypothetical protein